MAEPQPLRLLHDPATLRPSSLSYLRKRSTEEIVTSLRPDGPDPLIVHDEGTIMSGNTRVFILIERGYPVDGLPRVPYKS